MKTIPCVFVDVVDEEGKPSKCAVPVEPLPVDSVRNVYDGERNHYVCYENGDKLPEINK